MPVSVLIVDDSAFFRQRIRQVLSGDPRLKIVGEASNGREAVNQARQLKPDLITMDVEMPQLNGIEAVRLIMRENPTNILMLSSLTREGAQVTLQALDAGAADYLTKDVRAWSDHSGQASSELLERAIALGRNKRHISSNVFGTRPTAPGLSSRSHSLGQSSVSARTSAPAPAARQRGASAAIIPNACRLVMIGTSTGGPAALQKVLTALPATFPLPILLIQHMPKAFTGVFAERLNQQCQIQVKEAEDGDKLASGRALLAPGGSQMMIETQHPDRVRILPGDQRLTYKPSVDITYASAARTFGARSLAITLTGMGADGLDGARLLKKAGASVWAQNAESCTIYGMPKAVVDAGFADAVLNLEEISSLLARR